MKLLKVLEARGTKDIIVCSKILKKYIDLSNFLLFLLRKNRVRTFRSP